MRIRVEWRHIDNGYAGMPACCPVALAMLDAGLPEAGVFDDKLRWRYDANSPYTRVEMIPEVEKFVSDFDADKVVRPFEFELEVPNENQG